MDVMEIVFDRMDRAFDEIKKESRTSNAQILRRLSSQDIMLQSLDKRVETANSKTAAHEKAILDIQGKSNPGSFTQVLIEWGRQRWFPWIAFFVLASAGGQAIKSWADIILHAVTKP